MNNSFKKLGRVKLSVTGVNLDVFFNRAAQNGIALNKIKKQDDLNASFFVKWEKEQKLIDLFRGSCYTLKIEKYFGAAVVFNFINARMGVFMGIIIAAAVMLLMSQFVWKIEVTGCERLSAGQVHTALKAAGVSEGTFLPAIDSSTLEIKLKESLDEISLINISLRGTTVLVNLIEKIYVQVLEEDTALPIVARCDGQITSLLVLEGTALVKVGDSVVAGQMLIGNFTVDHNGTVVPGRARGSVVANVYYTHTVTFSAQTKTYVRTGNSVTQTDLSLFGFTWQLSKKENPYSDFEIETSTVYMFNNNFLPVRLTYRTYYETTLFETTLDYDRQIENFKYEARIMATALVPREYPVLSEQFSIKLVENTYYVTVYLKTSQSISERSKGE